MIFSSISYVPGIVNEFYSLLIILTEHNSLRLNENNKLEVLAWNHKKAKRKIQPCLYVKALGIDGFHIYL